MLSIESCLITLWDNGALSEDYFLLKAKENSFGIGLIICFGNGGNMYF